uniref:Uncharacterized protein n=1 Tax=Arundo donax TaxID=35708 RepID=A0A0A9AIZ1_ARUDO
MSLTSLASLDSWGSLPYIPYFEQSCSDHFIVSLVVVFRNYISRKKLVSSSWDLVLFAVL